MTQITTTTQPGDIVVVIPGWVMRLVGFLGLFGGFTMGLLVMLAGYPIEGFIYILFTLVWTPIWMLFFYIAWRFFWYLMAAWLACLAPLWVGSFLYIISGRVVLPRELQGITIKENPANGFIALLVAALITAVLYRIYMNSRGPQPAPSQSRAPQPEQAAPAAAQVVPDAPVDINLMDKVMAKLAKTGARGEVRGNTIYIYKGQKHIGIVRVIDRPAAISPVLVKDVASQKSRLGLEQAYLATSGHFTDDTRDLATQWGVKLMMV